MQDDYSRVLGRHQVSVGANVAYSTLDQMNAALSVGDFIFNGRATGSAWPTSHGQVSQFRHGAPGLLITNQWYIGLYARTLESEQSHHAEPGLRWEPYLGTNFENNAISNFSLDNFHKGFAARVRQRAARLIYPGDPASRRAERPEQEVDECSPRLGAAWDITGDGRLAAALSYALNYDFPGAVFQNTAVQAAPFNNRLDLIGNYPFDNPYSMIPAVRRIRDRRPADERGVPGSGSYAAIDPNINAIACSRGA
jgi:hypothetical protein